MYLFYSGINAVIGCLQTQFFPNANLFDRCWERLETAVSKSNKLLAMSQLYNVIIGSYSTSVWMSKCILTYKCL